MCCVSDIVCELFGETTRNMFECSCHLLLNDMVLFSVVEGALFDKQCMFFQIVCGVGPVCV